MASTQKCQYCGTTLSSDTKICPSCGAPNPNYVENTARTIFFPKTIAELQEYCAERGMPLLRMRFFIGEDFKEPKAFGIYQDGDDFVVYKNKANGQRAIRYRGPDEAHAVDEIFTKLLEECHNRGIYPDGKPESGSGIPSRSGRGRGNNRSSKSIRKIFLIAFMVSMAISVLAGVFSTIQHRNDGYYEYGNEVYYHYGNDWYHTSSSNDGWIESYDFPVDDYEDYAIGTDYDSDWGVSDFKESSAYQQIVEDNSSGSSDYDSWDSGGTDWDSDW